MGRKADGAFQPIGHLRRWRRRGRVVDLSCTGGRLRLEVLTPDVIRLRAARGETFAPDESWAVVKKRRPAVRFTVQDAGGALELTTASLRVEIRKRPLRLRYHDGAGRLLAADEARRGMGWQADGPAAYFDLVEGEHILGLGEKVGPLDKRGHAYEMWNTDAAPHVPNRDPIYSSFPVYLSLRPGAGYGRFFDHPGRSRFDFGYTEPGVFRYEAVGSELDCYFIHGPRPEQILRRYTALTGRMPLPPRWALGHQQSRYSYCPASRVRQIARGLRKRRIPTDAIYLDIEYMDGYRVFTWDAECFPDPRGLIAELHRLGLHVVTTVDPGVKKKTGYAVYEALRARGRFCRKPDGEPFTANVWPGESVFPDFLNAGVRRWWGDLHKGLLDAGVDGIWTDMNEPAMIGGPFGQTMDEDVVHDVDGRPRPHGEVHNVYGLLMARATREGLARLRPNRRGFVLTRSAYAGAQRYAAMWLGDNSSWWEHVQLTMPMCMSLSLAGMPFVGADIGGFFDDCTPELYARWMQLGAFCPLCRTHTCAGTRDQEPWAFGRRTERIARKYLELRYRLMPYTYTLFEECSRSGAPPMRPLAYAFGDDETCYQVGDQFLWGDALLVAPVYQEGVTHRAVYLPAGRWIDYWTGRAHGGPAWIVADAPLETLPLYVRAGSILPTAPVEQYAGQRPMDRLVLEVYAGDSGRFRLYEDDGVSLDYRKGLRAVTDLRYHESAGQVRLTVSRRKGRYAVGRRAIVAQFTGFPHRPSAVLRNGRPASARHDPDTGRVTLRWPDDGERCDVVLER